MLKNDKLIKEINDILTFHVITTNNLTRANLNDQAVLSEAFCSEFGSVIFGCNLESVATYKSNTEVVDLEDRINKIAVQVTVRNDRKKIQETLDKFISTKLYKNFDRLNFIILDLEVNYEKEFETQGLFDFSIKKNIFSLSKIILLIASLSIDKQEKILNILKKYIDYSRAEKQMSAEEWLKNVWMTACKIKTFCHTAVVPDYFGRKEMNTSESFDLAAEQADELKKFLDNPPLNISSLKIKDINKYYSNMIISMHNIRIFSANFDINNINDDAAMKRWIAADNARLNLEKLTNDLYESLSNMN